MIWLRISYASIIVGGISLLLGIISKLIGALILWNGPKGYWGFTIVCLIFAIYCCFMYTIKKKR